MSFDRRLWVLALLLACSDAISEEYVCTYQWEGKSNNHLFRFEVSGPFAKQKGSSLNLTYDILENSATEMMLSETHTKKRSGKDYPVGITVVVLDKASGKLIRSNTYADRSFNNFAYGECLQVTQ